MKKTELYARLEIEKDHSNFLEKLLRILYGEGWNKLTLDEAKKWRAQYLTHKSSEQKITGVCACGRELYIETVCERSFITYR